MKNGQQSRNSMKDPASNGGDHRLFANTPPDIQVLLPLLPNPNERELLLTELGKIAPSYDELGLVLGESAPFMKALVKELTSLNGVKPKRWTPKQTDPVCSALKLLSKVILSYPSPAMIFPIGDFYPYLFPLLSTQFKEGPVEMVIVCTLKVFYAMLTGPEDEAKRIILWADVVSPCLDVMLKGSLQSKICANAVLLKILWYDDSLLETASGSKVDCGNLLFPSGSKLDWGNMSFPLVVSALEKMFTYENRTLVKTSFHCCLFLTSYGEGCRELRRCLPNMINNGYLVHYIKTEPLHAFCLKNLSILIGKISAFATKVKAGRAMFMKPAEEMDKADYICPGAVLSKMVEDLSSSGYGHGYDYGYI